MSRIYRGGLALAASSALIAGALIGPSLASAKKTYKISMVQSNAKLSGINLTAIAKGKPFGKCKVTGTVTPPKVLVKWKCKGGTIKLTTTDATIKGAFFVSTAKLGSGTGKFKGIKGKLKAKGGVDGSNVIQMGTATY